MRSTATPHQRRNGSKEKRGRGLQENGRERMRPIHPVVVPARFAANRVVKYLEERPFAMFGEGHAPFGWRPLPGTTAFQSSFAPAGQAALAGGVSAAAGLFNGFETYRAGLAVEVTAAGCVEYPGLGVAAVGGCGGLGGGGRFLGGGLGRSGKGRNGEQERGGQGWNDGG